MDEKAPELPKVAFFAWKDATASMGWKDFEHAEGIDTCYSIGFVIADTPEYITIAGAISEEETCNATLSVPRGMLEFLLYLPPDTFSSLLKPSPVSAECLQPVTPSYGISSSGGTPYLQGEGSSVSVSTDQEPKE